MYSWRGDEMFYMADVNRWWAGQKKFIVNALGQRQDTMYILRDTAGFDVNIFDSEYEAREFAYQMVHGLLCPKTMPSSASLDFRKMLVRIDNMLDELNHSQRHGHTKYHRDFIGNLRAMVKDGIDHERRTNDERIEA